MLRNNSSIDLRSWALLAVVIVLCIFVGEVVIRARIFGSHAFSYTMMKSVRHIGESGLLQAAAQQEILWELRPNVDTLYKFQPFRTNSVGLRDREYTQAKDPGTFRIAVIGDSFTMGEGVAIEEVYHSVLERRFNANTLGKKYEFINFGVAGYSLVQYVATVQLKALNYKPDLILIGFCGSNDSKLPNLDAFNRPYQVKKEANGFLHLYSFELIGDVYKRFYNKLRGRYPGYNADTAYVDKGFKDLAALVSADRIPVVIAYMDNRAASSDLAMVEAAAARYGFGFINATSTFPKDVLEKYIIYLTDKHPNAAANLVFADAIHSALQVTIEQLH